MEGEFKSIVQLDELLSSFEISHGNLKKIKIDMLEHMENGLKGLKSDMKMLPTYVTALPNGNERGKYVALDLGGTSFRVLIVSLNGGAEFDQTTIKQFTIPEKVMTGTGTKLFDYMAQCIAIIVHENSLESYELPLGFTFSFPCEVKGLASANLLQWTKGFDIPEVIGQDVVKKLNEAIEARGNHVRVEAIVNDTVGCLCTGAYEDPKTQIGVIYGTGTNACYMEKVKSIKKLENPERYKKDEEMCINTEMGGFGAWGCLNEFRTIFDKEVDNCSLNPGQQIYEKMISGMYLGEICRVACIYFAERGVFFNGNVGTKFKTKDIFETEYVAAIVHDETPKLERAHFHLHYTLDIPNVTRQDCVGVQQLCKAVTKRAGQLAAVGLSALITRIGKDQLTISCEGSLYTKFPKFKEYIIEWLRILSPSAEVTFLTAQDASGRGAALVAASSQQAKPK